LIDNIDSKHSYIHELYVWFDGSYLSTDIGYYIIN